MNRIPLATLNTECSMLYLYSSLHPRVFNMCAYAHVDFWFLYYYYIIIIIIYIERESMWMWDDCAGTALRPL